MSNFNVTKTSIDTVNTHIRNVLIHQSLPHYLHLDASLTPVSDWDDNGISIYIPNRRCMTFTVNSDKPGNYIIQTFSTPEIDHDPKTGPCNTSHFLEFIRLMLLRHKPSLNRGFQ